MSGLWDVLVTVFWGLVTLSLLVFVHEGGHYLAARAFGMRVTEFFLGMPCKLRISHKSKRYGTEVGVTPVLLGGYTRICGMEGEVDEPQGQALHLLVTRGSICAEDLAQALGCDHDRALGMLLVLEDWASCRRQTYTGDAEVDDYHIAFDDLERDAELRTEYDRDHDFSATGVSAIGEPRQLDMGADDLLALERSRTYLGGSFWQRAVCLLAGPTVNLVLAWALLVGVLMGFGVQVGVNTNQIGSVEPGSLAEAAGLTAGDVVDSIDGVPVTDWLTLGDAVDDALATGQDFDIVYEHDGRAMTTMVDVPDGQTVQYLGVSAPVRTQYLTFGQASLVAFDYAGQVLSFAVRLIVPTHTMEVLGQSSSVVGISVMASEAARSGLETYLELLAAVSMSLGFMNLLPIPPLDGGKILIEVVQAARRKPVSLKVQNYISYAGLAFFLFVFVMALRNDILNIVMG